MTDWDKLFDKMYCIHYLPYKDRIEKTKNELSYAGILDSKNFEWFYTTDNIAYDMLYKKMLDMGMIFKMDETDHTKPIVEGYIKNERVFNLAMNVVNLLQQAYLLGYERILVIEDDIAFLKNKRMLDDIFHSYPLDYDLVSMEYWFRNDNDYSYATSDNRKINDHFCFLSREKIVNFSFVGLTRKGIKHILDGMNQKFICSDYYIANQDTYDDWKIKRAISRIPVCVQQVNDNSNHVA